MTFIQRRYEKDLLSAENDNLASLVVREIKWQGEFMTGMTTQSNN